MKSNDFIMQKSSWGYMKIIYNMEVNDERI